MKTLAVALLMLVALGCGRAAAGSFTERTNYMSVHGYDRWQYFLATGRW